MSQALEKVTVTKKATQAMLIRFKAQVECGKLIREISTIIDNPASYQIRFLAAIENIAAVGGNNLLIIKTNLENPDKV